LTLGTCHNGTTAVIAGTLDPLTAETDLPPHIEQLQQVIELPMNVSDNSRWNWDVVNILLLHENLLGLVAKVLDILLRNDLTGLESRDGPVQVHAIKRGLSGIVRVVFRAIEH
jgi:hypothetical protein